MDSSEISANSGVTTSSGASGIWESVKTWFVDGYGWAKILQAVVVAIIGFVIIKIVVGVINRGLNKSKLKGLAGDLIKKVIEVVLLVVYILILLKILGIDTSSFVALLATCSLAISLALQATLSNLASGMIIVSNKPFEEGDYVEINGIGGTVKTISLFSTTLITPNNQVVTLPNSTVAGDNIINYNKLKTRRIDKIISVEYGTDVDKVKEVLTKVLDDSELVLHDEGYTVRLKEMASSSLDFVFRCYVKTGDYWEAYFSLNEAVIKAFNENNIVIPYNKLDVNVIKE